MSSKVFSTISGEYHDTLHKTWTQRKTVSHGHREKPLACVVGGASGIISSHPGRQVTYIIRNVIIHTVYTTCLVDAERDAPEGLVFRSSAQHHLLVHRPKLIVVI